MTRRMEWCSAKRCWPTRRFGSGSPALAPSPRPEGFRCGSGCSLVEGAAELQQLRWETLREPQERDRLLTDEHLLFSRFLSSDEGVSVPFRPRAELRALVVIANPSDLAEYGLAPLDVDAELQRARTGLGDIACTELPGQGRPTLADITAQLREGYDILYLVCHGAMRAGEARLWLEDETGHTQRLPGQELADRLRELSRRPRLVVLASCQSAGDGAEVHAQDDGGLARLGPKLARGGIPAVVAMQGNVSKRRSMPSCRGSLKSSSVMAKSTAL